ncbi:hypothetical protein LWI29_010345 [Acer saccharum]|uniref:Ammonium transporter AmtB-like domain-containing protein n=1 Tax=Acer saccharum TaxID=4024 RepID=A0AA39RYI2_ACESA|nr:hypothetical protein LWI29_010345 [Acer saccharum]
MATLVYFQFTFAAITVILLAGSVLARMNIKAWMAFVPLWLIFSYTVGAFSLWGGGFLYHWGVIDYSGGFVIHLSSGIAGLTAAYWVGPRLKSDRERFPPNNVLLMLAGAGLLWMGWSACLCGHLLMFYFGKPSVIGAVQGMVTGLACITPGAGLVQCWAAIVFGILSGSIPWVSMMILHKKSSLLQKVDDTLGVFHTRSGRAAWCDINRSTSRARALQANIACAQHKGRLLRWKRRHPTTEAAGRGGVRYRMEHC